jgi:hypothetical protein
MSSQTPAPRRARHQPDVPRDTSRSLTADVSTDTYKIKRSHQTEQQETEQADLSQERDEVREGTEPGATWDQVKQELSAILAPSVYQGRVAPTRQVPSSNAGEIVVLCPDDATSRWLERQLGRSIREIARALPGAPPLIRFTAHMHEQA